MAEDGAEKVKETGGGSKTVVAGWSSQDIELFPQSSWNRGVISSTAWCRASSMTSVSRSSKRSTSTVSQLESPSLVWDGCSVVTIGEPLADAERERRSGVLIVSGWFVVCNDSEEMSQWVQQWMACRAIHGGRSVRLGTSVSGCGGLSKPKVTHEGAEAHNARFSPRIRRKLWDPSPKSDESCGTRIPNQQLWSPSSESVVVKPELRIILLH